MAQALTEADIEHLFTYHPPKGDQAQRYELLREIGKQMAQVILLLTPPGPDQTACIRKVREAVMTANQAIACGKAEDCPPIDQDILAYILREAPKL